MTLNVYEYLDTKAETGVITQEFIDEYKKLHSGRDKWGKGQSYSRQGTHPFGSDPFCNICWKKYEIGDRVYKFYVGWHNTIFYHINCFDRARKSKQKGIIYQDRAVRRRNQQ